MRRMLLMGAALCSLSACGDDTAAFERCAALHRGEPRVGQCQYTLRSANVGNILAAGAAGFAYGATSQPPPVYMAQPVYTPMPQPTFTRTVCRPMIGGMSCVTQ